MSNKAPAFQLYAEDFLTGCTYLTNEEIGMYIKMLCKQWTDGNIPKKRLGFLLGIEWVSLSDELKSKFIDKGDFIINERLEKEREKKMIFKQKQAENGKKGGRPVKEKKSGSLDNKGEKPKPFQNDNPNHNPNKTQKKPLEDEDEIENEKGKEIIKRGYGGKNIVFPFQSTFFLEQWQEWKNYKLAEFKFKYKSIQSEQAALNELNKLSNSDEQTAIAIIHQSMSKSWKGFFELKNSTNGQQKSNTEIFTDAANSETARNFKFG